MLPAIKKVVLQSNVFPTRWQAVLFRNYGLVSSQVLAGLLGCDENILKAEAERLGLRHETDGDTWRTKGYVTLIRNNWFLLPYEQICQLIGVEESRLDFILQHDDFLSVKLGGYKPYCEKVSYSPLTKLQAEKTQAISEKVAKYARGYSVAPFDFFKEESKIETAVHANGARIVHGYLSPCGDVFMQDSNAYMPDELLQRYAAQGVNGIWLHGLLANLSPYPFQPTMSKHYQQRRSNLQALIKRCQAYGVKVYLYFNEPRGLAENAFGKYAYLKGHTENGYASLCFSHKESKEYLYNAVKDLFSNVKDLGGVITITMSENLTHCNYRSHTNCPICKNVSPEQSAAEVNNIIQRAIKDSGSGAELIANLWGWSPFMDWTEEQTLRGVELLDKDVSVMCVSEYDLHIEKGGVESKIIDYSISNPGPSEITQKTLKKGAETGHKLYAKIQINNSWECSAVPYLPVFDLVYEHLCNLSKIGVRDYMLTWTLGGYPSPMLGMTAEYAKNPQAFSLADWYQREYGADSAQVKQAVSCFCQGFREYPFSIDSLYFSPKTLGCANLWSLEKEEKQSTMVCYAFDDYENWIKPYSVGVYLSQYEKLLTAWETGCQLLEGNVGEKVVQLRIFAKAALSHFKADYLQTKFSYLKRDSKKNAEELKKTITQERENALQLLDLLYDNACVGFEASNHYYYTDRNLVEKILLMEQFCEEV